MDYWFAKEHGFSLDDYLLVYTGEIKSERPHIYEVLEDIFGKFNTNLPEDFRGHSLSVSDIVELDGVKYYCDSTEWTEIDSNDLLQ